MSEKEDLASLTCYGQGSYVAPFNVVHSSMFFFLSLIALSRFFLGASMLAAESSAWLEEAAGYIKDGLQFIEWSLRAEKPVPPLRGEQGRSMFIFMWLRELSPTCLSAYQFD